MMRQLKNTSCYQKLTFNPLSKYRDELRVLLQEAVDSDVLTVKQMEGLWIDEPTVASIYLLPKIHKNPLTPPVSRCGGMIAWCNKGVHDIVYHVRIVTNGFYIAHTFPPNTRYRYGGVLCALTCEPFFLGFSEREIFQVSPHQLSTRVVSWWRYIDDVLMIWQGTCDELDAFFTVLNNNSKNIKLTYKYSTSSIEFLDISIFVYGDGFLQTDLYRKSTSANSVLHASSQHPRHLIRNIPTGQYLRAKRICSNNILLEKQALDLSQRFKDRGYGKRIICRSYQRAFRSRRIDLLQQKRIIGQQDQVRCVLDYNSRSQEIRDIIARHWHILQLDDVISKCIGDTPEITFRRSQNLRDQLVHSYYSGPRQKYIFGSKGPKWGCTRCGKCVACKNICESTGFSNSTMDKNYVITHTITCTTKAVVYHATCPCGLIYVGMTTRELRRRVHEHILDIEKAATEEDSYNLKPIPRHFKSLHKCDPTGLMVKGIDRIFIGPRGGNWKRLLAQRESKWIHKLNTITPYGLNDHNSFVPFLPV
ncbi:unnamed protein product [Ranitomeya imitator]|uniref:Helix-turn-helix domain-containing protein n=1 Tax=Ranitomeya imitator TaxID=111125 RepID=A0ABN9MJM2_9NEOB|nr:unnamed protein product [Ranitomeya imitator]